MFDTDNEEPCSRPETSGRAVLSERSGDNSWRFLQELTPMPSEKKVKGHSFGDNRVAPTLLDAWRAYCQDGDERAFEVIFEGTRGLVFTICRSVLRNEEDALEAFQGAYERVVAAAGRPEEAGAVDDVGKFAGRMAALEADRLRKRRMRRARKEIAVEHVPEGQQSGTDAPDGILRQQQRRILEALIDTLPEKYRVPVRLYYFHGLTHQEIADILGMPRGSISARLSRAVRKLEPKMKRAGLGKPEVLFSSLLATAALLSPPATATAHGVLAAAHASLASGGAAAATAGTSAGVSASAKFPWILGAAAAVLIAFGTYAINRNTPPPQPTPSPVSSASVAPVGDAGDSAKFVAPATERTRQDTTPGSNKRTPSLSDPELSGIVLTPEGQPVLDTYVQWINVRAGNEPRGNDSAHVFVNEQGAFSLPVSPHTTGELLLISPRYISHHGEFAIGAAAPEPLRIILPVGASAEGRVTDSFGDPIPGVEIRVVQSWRTLAGEEKEYELNAQRVQADGRFSFEKLSPVSVHFEARHPDLAEPVSLARVLEPGGHLADLDFILPIEYPGIAGRVTNEAGEPLSDVTVSARMLVSSYMLSLPNEETRTTEDGRYFIKVPSDSAWSTGTRTVLATADGYESMTREGVAVGTRDADFVLRKSLDAVFVGTLLDKQTGAPITEAFVVQDARPSFATGDFPVGEDGSFIVDSLESGSEYVLSIYAPGYLPLARQYVTIPAQTERAAQTWELVRDGNVVGRLVDAQTGEPLAGVTVLLPAINDWFHGEGGHGGVLTDAQGRFHFFGVPWGRQQVSILPAEPYVPRIEYAWVQENEVADLGDLAIGAGTKLTLQLVEDGTGEALPNTRVRLSGFALPSWRVADLETDEWQVTSGQDGAIEIAGLRPGERLFVEVPGHGERAIVAIGEGPVQQQTLALGTASLKGRLLKGTEPVSGNLELALRRDGIEYRRKASANRDGEYAFAHLPSGTWTVGITGSYRDEPRSTASLTLAAGTETKRDFVLPGGQIEGRVLAADGSLVEGAVVSIAAAGGDNPGSAPRSTVSDEEGRFAFSDLAESLHDIWALHSEQGTGMLAGVAASAGTAVEVQLTPVAESGRIVSAAYGLPDGAPLRSAWCLVTGLDSSFRVLGTKRGRDGLLTLDGVPPGRYAVEVSAWGYSLSAREVEVVSGGTVEFDDVLHPAGALRLTVEDSTGQPLASIECVLDPVGGQVLEAAARHGATGAGGIWTVRGLEGGDYQLTVTTPAGEQRRETLTIVAGEITTLTLQLP
ncbi:MAG: hypothetical protein PWP23_560 [Candidatus Sumerlaeota bacterium]|nr:hypothetical protein [Candidatus Sumerlaeota bacterium]